MKEPDASFEKFYKLLLCLLVAVAMYANSVSFTILAAGKETIVLACSDFQPSDGNITTGQRTVEDILSAIKADGIASADGFLCAGDYAVTYTAEDCSAGLAALKDKVDGFVTGEMAFLQGNHDPAETIGLSKGGKNDPNNGAYGVYLIHEDDYSWTGESDEVEVENTAAALKTYLDGKLASKWNKPIFIVSHIQLHYSMRTYQQQDGKYANILFDVINEAAGKGLNIVFLFGHNHSNGWDDYLGGAAVYLKKGDTINIAQGSTTEFERKKLNFTYMNAGYVGYYGNVNSGSDSTLTMSVFRIVGNEVTVSRYDRNGLHNLKSKGVQNTYKKEDVLRLYSPNRIVYASSRIVTATDDIDATEANNTTIKPTTSTTTKTTTGKQTATTTGAVGTNGGITTAPGIGTDEVITTTGADASQMDAVTTDTTDAVADGATVTTTTAANAMDGDASQDKPNNGWVVWVIVGGVAVLAAGVVTILVFKKKTA